MKDQKKNLRLVRDEMKRRGLDACLIPMTDPHMSEYVPDHWRTIQWFSGFSGSAGTLVITMNFAGLWTDSRYFLQAEDQLQNTGISLVKLKISHTPEYIEWLKDTLPRGSVVGLDGKCYSTGLFRMLEKKPGEKEIKIDPAQDMISSLWKDRPAFPSSKFFEHEIQYAGISRKDKINRIREQMQLAGVDIHLLTALDDIAWTFNIRGNDVKYSPLAVSYGMVGLEHTWLFTDQKRIPAGLKRALKKDGVEILLYEDIYNPETLHITNKKVFLSPGSVNTRLFNAWKEKNDIVEGISIPTRLKAVKNAVEIKNIKSVMVRDGIALTKFFFWLEKNIGKIKITEVSAARKLKEFRAKQENFMSPSFGTIAGYKAHGAIVHYEANEQSDVPLHPEGIFLLDSGGQYFDGTTDITRTISLGNPTPEEIKDFTLVLKGTIQLALTHYPAGTKGYQIEAFARRALWNEGLNYGHGTGHGVGFFLNVHEGPQTIGSAASGNRDVALEPGMLISDEPGLYREGKYGIRTENLVLVASGLTTEFGDFLKFETVSLCYIDLNLIDRSLLTPDEINWLNVYHQKVYEKISPYLSREEQIWLKNKTLPV